ncbi:MAG: chorismate mutase [Pseudobdellovibrionaceae bacterium]
MKVKKGLTMAKKSMTQKPSLKELPALREKISSMDLELLKLLQKRFAVVHRIGEVKRAHDLPIVQTQRLEYLNQLWFAEAEKRGLNIRFIKKILHYIHNESVRLQKGPL